jgi:transposase
LVKVKKMTQQDVANLFDVSRQRVSGLISRFDETGSHKDCQEMGRKRTTTGEKIVQEVTDLL